MSHDDVLRRRFLVRSGQFLALTVASPYIVSGAPKFVSNPFTLGVASGDPTPDGVVLWTRLAPEPLAGGGMPPERVDVQWQVARDEKMQQIVKKGRAVASPDLAHSVHVEVDGLQPETWYWYRFLTGDHVSTTGRTKTAPHPKTKVGKLRFAFASCQNYEYGYFNAYQHMATEDLDLVVHLGDYIYEGGPGQGRPRQHNAAEPSTLNDYRNRHALYRSDAELQKAHAQFPWIVTWDDHEVQNNYADDKSEKGLSREQFLEKRSNAYQAYYEHLPLRKTSLPHGPKMKLYRRLVFGDLADFLVLDTRQYRTDQPCGDGNKPQCPEALAETGTLMGREQEQWFFTQMQASRSRWNVVAQQVMMAKVDRKAGPEQLYAMDQWSGYEAERRRVLRFLQERKPSNPVVITGDIHTNWVADLKADFDDPKSAIVGTEFVGTSITSGGDGADSMPAVEAYLPENPHVHFYNNQRGYVRCELTPEKWQSDYRVVDFVSRPGSSVKTRASFVVENGRPGAQRAQG